jgi:hypothetical protein
MSLTKLSLAGNNLIIPGQREFGLFGKSLTFFYSVTIELHQAPLGSAIHPAEGYNYSYNHREFML